MEADGLPAFSLGLLLLPLLATLLAVLCVRCRELPTSYDSASVDSLYPPRIIIKPHYTLAPRPPAPSYPPVTSCPPPSQPDLLPIPRSPQPPGGSHRMPSSRQDSDDANSVPSYENQEPSCEGVDEDEDEDNYPSDGNNYLVVLPDNTPATGTAIASAPVPSNPGLRDSAFSMESSKDYVNIPDGEESAEASLDGSQEYVNVSQELQPGPSAESACLEEEEQQEEEEAPDYENLQELS